MSGFHPVIINNVLHSARILGEAIAHKADDDGTTLRTAALALGVRADQFARVVDPSSMVGDPRRDLGLERTDLPRG